MKPLVSLTVGAVAALSLAACGSSGSTKSTDSSSPGPATKNLSANGVSFQYPDSWDSLTDVKTNAQKGSELWSENVGPDTTNFAIMSAYTVGLEVTDKNIASVQPEVASTLKGLAEQGGGSVTSPIKVEATAGYPGFSQELTVKTPSGQEVASTLWLFFNGKTEYFMNCQYVPADQATMIAGCQTIRSTFKVTG